MTKSLMTVQVRFYSQMKLLKTNKQTNNKKKTPKTDFQNILDIRVVDRGLQTCTRQSQGVGGPQRK